MKARIAQLEEQLDQYSKNSSKPLTTDQEASCSSLPQAENRPYHPGANRELLPARAVISYEVRSVEGLSTLLLLLCMRLN
ncbi:hypothetical protein DB42_AA00670 [Neochlamydia sp. EPS4]|uniref:DUF6444 domain-containing protein n=1 Tax=Neochlamydia sp. EPS4 TaxID=1478175 RepID=UPI0005826AE5|nr:hypothetical protein DB42_AA00670 [Neochlamydia sp. EPS4]